MPFGGAGKKGYIRSMSSSTTRFSDRVEDYVKYRPHYPEAIVGYLRDVYRLDPGWVVADVGSGTGISSELFLHKGNRVYGVEPNREMREKAEKLLAGYMDGVEVAQAASAEAAQAASVEWAEVVSADGAKAGSGSAGGGRFVSIDGTAEATGLGDGSVDMIVAGQAFHWFDPARSRVEWVRMLRPGGVVVLIWNERLIAKPFEKAYEDLILQYGTDYTYVKHKVNSDEKISAFFHPAVFTMAVFPNEQLFDFAGLKGRLLSSSYIPKEGNEAMLQALRELFDRHATGGRVRVGYDTKVYSGVLKS
jgi:SAM-dependent methyltransferase